MYAYWINDCQPRTPASENVCAKTLPPLPQCGTPRGWCRAAVGGRHFLGPCVCSGSGSLAQVAGPVPLRAALRFLRAIKILRYVNPQWQGTRATIAVAPFVSSEMFSEMTGLLNPKSSEIVGHFPFCKAILVVCLGHDEGVFRFRYV